MPNAFKGLQTLPLLNLSYLSLKSIDANTFIGLDSLSSLDLSHNNIKSIKPSAFSGLASVVTLDLSYNAIIDFSDKMFAEFDSLSYLRSDDYMYCCFVRGMVEEQNCLPKKDELSSCDDLIGRTVLKIFLWAIGSFAFFGQAAS